jgi:hypothetical protein
MSATKQAVWLEVCKENLGFRFLGYLWILYPLQV